MLIRYRWVLTTASTSRPLFFQSKRYKFDMREKDLWKKTHSHLALDHFDGMYGAFYGKMWPSIRLSMLSQPKYCALVNYYGDYEATIQMLRDLGCVDIQETFEAGRDRISGKKARRQRGSAATTQKEVELEEVEPSSEDRIINPGMSNASMFNFVPTKELKGMETFVQEEDQLKYMKQSPDFTVPSQPDEKLLIPPLLKAFVFVRGDVSRFPRPKRTSLGTFNYYLMDAASILPVLALNLQPFDSVLDLCASPGGKSLAMLQTVFPNKIVCNDRTPTRVARLRSVLDQYLGVTQSWEDDRLEILTTDALLWRRFDAFDKVLVDVPCTTDRHSATVDDNNIFKPGRIRERVTLPETQTHLLCAGVRACKPGGTVVYSTCSLSPVQNDGVVYMALKRLKEVHNIETVVSDMTTTMQGFDFLSRFAPASLMRYGQTVLPSIPNNYGPMYISKIMRIK